MKIDYYTGSMYVTERALELTEKYWEDYYRQQGYEEFISTAVVAGAVLIAMKVGGAIGAAYGGGIPVGTNLGKLGTLVQNPGIKVA